MKNVIYDNLKKARVTEFDVKAKLREANVLELSQVRGVIFETNGDIALFHTDDINQNIESWIIDGVDE